MTTVRSEAGLQRNLAEITRLLEKHRVLESLTHRQEGPRRDLLENLQHRQNEAELRKRLRMMHAADLAYILEALPFGYSLWQRPRPSNPAHFDRYLYGHPGKKPFDSPNRFFPHFEYMMENDGIGMGCPCKVCSGSAGVLPGATPNSSRTRTPSVTSQKSNSSAPISSRPSSSRSVQPSALPSLAAQHKGRLKKITPGLDKSNVDGEGTPDVIGISLTSSADTSTWMSLLKNR